MISTICVLILWNVGTNRDKIKDFNNRWSLICECVGHSQAGAFTVSKFCYRCHLLMARRTSRLCYADIPHTWPDPERSGVTRPREIECQGCTGSGIFAGELLQVQLENKAIIRVSNVNGRLCHTYFTNWMVSCAVSSSGIHQHLLNAPPLSEGLRLRLKQH